MKDVASQILGEARDGGFSFVINFGYSGDLVEFLNNREVPHWVRSQIEHQLANGINTSIALDGDEPENDDEGVYVASHADDAEFLINTIFGASVPNNRGMFNLPSHEASKEVVKFLKKVGIDAELNIPDDEPNETIDDAL
jgi:hypothetical protein